MLYLIAIVVALLGGLLGRAFMFREVRHRLLAFIVPVTLSAALMHVPIVVEILRSGLPPLQWAVLSELSRFQAIILLSAALLTSFGWFCAYCIQSIFED